MKTKLLLLSVFLLISPFVFSQSIQSFTPASGNAGEMINVTISGQNTLFQQGTDVISLSNGASVVFPQQSTFLNDSVIQSVFAFNKDHQTGYYLLSIAKNSSYTLNLDSSFYLNADPSIAVIDSITPQVASQGETKTLTIKGVNTHFGSPGVTTTVSMLHGAQLINGTNIVVLDSVTLQVQFAFTYAHLTGVYDVTVSNILDGAVTATGGFILNTGSSVPVIVSCQPNTGTQGEFLTVSITGQNTLFQQGTDMISLSNGSTVVSPQQSTFVNDTLIQSVFAFNVDHPTGYYNMLIQKNGSYLLRLDSSFYLNPDPSPGSIASVSPSFGIQGTQATITINGFNTNFGLGGTTTTAWLKQGSQQINPASITVIDSVTLQVQFNLTYGYSSGLYNVCVTNTLDGAMVLMNGMSVNPGTGVPEITSVTPNAGLLGETLSVSITGQNTLFEQGTDNIHLAQGGTSINPSGLSFVSATVMTATFTFATYYPTGFYDVVVTGNDLITLVDGFNLALSLTDSSSYISYAPGSDSTVIALSSQAFDFATYLGANLTYSAMMGDGNPLPGNVIFDPIDLTITILYAKDSPAETIIVTAMDEYTQSASVSIPAAQYLAGMAHNLTAQTHDVSIFPNPAKDRITLVSTGSENNARITIYDLQGQLLIQQASVQNRTELDLSNLQAGVYVIKWTQADRTIVKRLVKE